MGLCAQYALSSSVVRLSSDGTTYAATTSPRSASGTPMTALSATLGWPLSTASICAG